jgi:hypothetical protein
VVKTSNRFFFVIIPNSLLCPLLFLRCVAGFVPTGPKPGGTAGSEGCAQCPAGRFSNGATCDQCDFGKYASNNGSASCQGPCRVCVCAAREGQGKEDPELRLRMVAHLDLGDHAFVRTSAHPTPVCPANTSASVMGTVTCSACGSGLVSVPGSAVCCPVLQSCQQLINTSLPSMYNPVTRACDNVVNKANGTLCNTLDTTRCLKESRCTGLVGTCPNPEVQSVTNVSAVSFTIASTTSSSSTSLRLQLTGVTVPSVCPAVPTSGYTFQVSGRGVRGEG